MNETIRHGLPLLAVAQAQKEVTHNEALLAIDRRLQIAVATRGSNVPPAAPAVGECHIVGGAPTGVWSCQPDAIALHDGFGWVFTPPQTGFVAYVTQEAVMAVYDGGWQADAWPVSGLRIGDRLVLGATPLVVAPPVGGDVVDAQLRTAFAELLAALVSQGVTI